MEARGYLLRQLDTAWKLARFHLDGLTTEECLWRPAMRGLHVTQREDGRWCADWPEREGYDIGFGPGTLERGSVAWPGSADAVRRALNRLHDPWRAAIAKLSDPDLGSPTQARWPFRDRPFGDVVAWANVELVKNASEVGYARFLYASREPVAAP
jgi:hypothetical protein